jgi:hypothetical protein
MGVHETGSTSPDGKPIVLSVRGPGFEHPDPQIVNNHNWPVELFNEPQDISHDQWLSGYQGLYKAVRDTGAKNICIVGGLDWAYDLSFVPDKFHVKGDNIVYCSHPYYPKGNDHRGIFEPTSNFAGVLGKFPVIFTEFGVNGTPDGKKLYNKKLWNASDGKEYKGLNQEGLQYYDQVISYMLHTRFHYTGWAWWVDNKEPWFPALIWDWESGTAWNGGTPIHEDIRARSTPIGSS